MSYTISKTYEITFLCTFRRLFSRHSTFLRYESPTQSNSVGHFLRTVHTCYPFLFSAPAFALV